MNSPRVLVLVLLLGLPQFCLKDRVSIRERRHDVEHCRRDALGKVRQVEVLYSSLLELRVNHRCVRFKDRPDGGKQLGVEVLHLAVRRQEDALGGIRALGEVLVQGSKLLRACNGWPVLKV